MCCLATCDSLKEAYLITLLKRQIRKTVPIGRSLNSLYLTFKAQDLDLLNQCPF